LSHDPRSGLAEILAFIPGFGPIFVGIGTLLSAIRTALQFIGFCPLLCHAHSLRQPHSGRYPVEIQTAPLPKFQTFRRLVLAL
jgi:hypothetical protein